MASLNPLSFNDNSEVVIDNSWLKIATSKNYHHFFPKSYMANHQKDTEEFFVNHIANITIVKDTLNKNTIRAKAPSKYINEFIKINPKIFKTIKSHLIDIEDYDILNDNFELFFDKRCLAISNEISKRVLLTDSDNLIEALENDTEEVVVEEN